MVQDATPPDVMRINASGALMLWIIVAAAMAAALSFFYLPSAVGFAICGVLLPYAGWAVALHTRQWHPAAITALRCGPDALSYQLKGGKWITGNILSGGLVSRWITVVRMQDEASPPRIRYLVLLASQLSAEQYRQLLVHLRWNVSGQRDSRF